MLVGELDRFETLLNDLLEISRHDAGVAELSVEAVDLRTTINRALGNVGHLADEAGIELLVDMGDEAVIAEVDPRRVERILRNLIANAIDHAEHKPVLITMAADSDTVAVTVRDRGVGLRPGEEKLVFSRFWRPDWEAFWRVFRLGWPIGLTGLAESALFQASALMMGWIGTVQLAAHGIALEACALAFMVHLGLSNAATVRVGWADGARDARSPVARSRQTHRAEPAGRGKSH